MKWTLISRTKCISQIPTVIYFIAYLLHSLHLIEETFLCHKLVVAADLDANAAAQDCDAVCVAYCRESVRNDERGAVGRKVVDSLLYLALGDAVKRAGRLVEDNDRGIANDSASYRDALTLTAREICTVLGQHRVDAFGQGIDKICELSRLDRASDVVRRRVFNSVGYVLADSSGEKHAVLRHDRYVRAVAVKVDLFDILAVDKHLTARGKIKSENEVESCGLAAARLADERDGLACAYVERESVEQLLICIIGEGNVLEFVVSLKLVDLYLVGVVLNVGRAQYFAYRGNRVKSLCDYGQKREEARDLSGYAREVGLIKRNVTNLNEALERHK